MVIGFTRDPSFLIFERPAMLTSTRLTFAALFASATLLSACGGGGGGGGGGTNPPASVYTPPANVVAAKQVSYSTPFYGSTGTGSGCNNVKNTTVYLLPNTVTYAADGVTELAQQQAADYAEQAVVSLRSTLNLPSSVGVLNNNRVQICAQTNLVLGSAQGMGEKDGLRVTSSNSTSLDSAYLANDFDMYKRLFKHEMVHVYHQGVFGNNNAVLDTWFAEGLAEFIASGKSSKSKTDILNLVNTQNPIAVMTTGLLSGSGNLTYYPAFQSSVAYLFDANGAKNNLTALPAFFDLMKTNYDTGSMNCAPTNSCTTFREVAFQQSFEATFKEADGTSMKLRTGANNLQDTIYTRLSSFLQ
jgi:hypothetical protein